MWARVKFTLDSKVFNKPLTAFKEADEVEKELNRREVREIYRVFWSMDENETAENVQRREGRVLDVDSVQESLEIVPISGFYKAIILNYANSEEALVELLATPQGRRIPKPNIHSHEEQSARSEKRKKIANMKAASQINKKKFKISGEEVVALPDYGKTESGEGVIVHKETRRISSELSKRDQAKSKGPSESSEENNSDDDDVPYVMYEDQVQKLKELKKKFEKAERLISEMRTEIEKCKESAEIYRKKFEESEVKRKQIDVDLQDYIRLNKFYQEKEIERKLARTSRSIHSPSSSHHRSPSANRLSKPVSDLAHCSSSSHGSRNPKSTPSVLSLSSSTSSHSVTEFRKCSTSLFQSSSGTLLATNNTASSNADNNMDASDFTILENTEESQKYAPSILEEKILNEDVAIANNDEQKSDLNTEVNSTEAAHGIVIGGVKPISFPQFLTCLTQNMKNKPGVVGDGQFVKNIAGIIWTNEELENRSAAGKGSATRNAPSRPECTPEKKEYCAALLRKRIELQEPNCLVDNMERRTRQVEIKKYLRARIKTLRRENK